MPCKCKIPYETYPEAKDWGPVLWTILHGIAERVGTCPFPTQRNDERRGLLSLFVKLGKMIPCPSCKEHYEVFLKENPVGQIKDAPYESLRPFIRDWFWRLHSMVNESKSAPSFPMENLEATYKNANLRMALTQLKNPMQKAIRIAGKMFIAHQDFHACILMLLSNYGL